MSQHAAFDERGHKVWFQRWPCEDPQRGNNSVSKLLSPQRSAGPLHKVCSHSVFRIQGSLRDTENGTRTHAALADCFFKRFRFISQFPSDLGIIDFAEVAVVGGFGVDWAEEVELFDDVGGFEGENFQDGVEDGVIAVVAGAEGVDVNANGFGVTDGVGKLDFATGGEAGGDDIFGDPTAHVGSAAVHFGRVLAGKGTAAVTAHAAVGINDDFASGQATVTLRPADNEVAGRVDQVFGLRGQHFFWQDFFDDLFDAEFFDLGMWHISGVLGGDDDVDDAGGFAVYVFDGDLRLGVGAQPLGEFASFANAGQFATKAVGKHDGGGHEFGSLIAGVTEHDALVTSALFCGFLAFGSGSVHALSDVRALDGEVVVDENLVGVENVVSIGVTNPANGIADHLTNVDDFVDGLGGAVLFVLELRDSDFTADDHDIAFDKGFTCHAAFGIEGKAGVEDGVGDGVSDFVGMAFADGLG